MTAAASQASAALDFDPFGAAFRSDPESWYPKLLAASPGFIEMEKIPSAFVAQHAHVTAVMRDFKRFSSVKPMGLPGMERVDFFNGQPVMNYSDPPDHQRLRRVVNSCFSPKRVARIADGAARILDELLDSVEAGQTVEVVGRIAKPLSTRLLLGEFLDVAEADHHIFLDYLRSIPLLDAVRPGGQKPKAFLDAWQAGVSYCRGVIAHARQSRSDDLIGLIAAAHDDGGTMSDDEMMAMMVVLFSGGISTVGAAITAALLHMAQHPDIAGRVRADSALAGNVLEESIRLASPVALVMRFAVEDVEIGGGLIRRGMPVYTMIAAASRDPAAFPEPQRFDIDRPNLKDHVAFGHGIHTCIGNTITRATVPMVVETVVRRYPALRPADSGDGPIWETTPRSRHIGSLPLSF